MVLAMTVALFVAELGVRLLFPTWAPRTPRLTAFWQFDPDLGWAHVPSTGGPFQAPGFDTLVAINSDGFRGPEIAESKDPSRLRVVVFGDSFVWGFGVNQEEIFTTRMESGCPSLEVINLGVSGYATDQELLLLKKRGAAYAPDIVILLFASNDVASNARPTEYLYYHKPVFVIEDGELVLTNWPVPQANIFVRTAASIARKSYILTQSGRLLQGLSEKRMDRIGPSASRRRTPAVSVAGSLSTTLSQSFLSPEPAVTKAFPRNASHRITTLLLREFVAAVEASGAKLMIVLTDGHGKLGREMMEFTDTGDVPVEYLDDVMPNDAYDRLHLPDDFHWNVEGHDLVAQTVLQALLNAELVPPEMCPN